MIGGLPLIPDGHDPEAIHAKWVNDELTMRRKVAHVDGVGVSQTTRGDFVQVEPQAGGGTRPKMLKLRDVRDDYLVCHSWDGTTEGATDIYVAKEPLHRESLTTETILGDDHGYTYSDGPSEDWTIETSTRFNRVRTDDFASEDQRITPPWRDGETIFAMPAKTGATRLQDPDMPFDEDTNPKIKIGLLIIGRSCGWAGPVT